ncbi:MAG: hypothetical protein QXI42_09105 [Thermoproteota archaeon]
MFKYTFMLQLGKNMPELADEEIKNHILFKLHWRKCWGGKHTAIESVKKGVPKHLGGRYMDMVEELVKEGLLLSKPTAYGLQISLNPRRREEIIERVERFARR